MAGAAAAVGQEAIPAGAVGGKRKAVGHQGWLCLPTHCALDISGHVRAPDSHPYVTLLQAFLSSAVSNGGTSTLRAVPREVSCLKNLKNGWEKGSSSVLYPSVFRKLHLNSEEQPARSPRPLPNSHSPV